MIQAAKRMRGVLWLAFIWAGLSTSSCQLATGGEKDLPREEWVVTSANVVWDSSHTAYDTHVTITYADPSEVAAGNGYTDDYAGQIGTIPSKLYSISTGDILGADYQFFVLSSSPDPATHPVITFDTNHYIYRRGSGYSVGVAEAKCHIKTASIAVTFEQ